MARYFLLRGVFWGIHFPKPSSIGDVLRHRPDSPSGMFTLPSSDTIDMPLRRVFGRISQVLCSADCHPVPASLKQGVGDIASAVNVNYVSTDRL